MKLAKFLAVLLALILLAGCGSKTANAEIVGYQMFCLEK